MANRLRLDFNLKYSDERAAFVQKYLSQAEFKRWPPTPEECETIGNYILWGADHVTGLNVKQTHEVQLETRHKTWDARADESLDALLENPGFNETTLRHADEPPTKVRRESFSRSATRAEAPASMLPRFEELWHQIDTLDLIINFYDLAHGRRKTPPRESLLALFSESQLDEARARAARLNQYSYLKMRHFLVELRREQFALRDSYISPIQLNETPAPRFEYWNTLDVEVAVLPLGCAYNPKIFPPDGFPCPADFTESEISTIIHDYWSRLSAAASSKFCFDFRELEHIYEVFLLMDEFEEDAERHENILSNNPQFLNTLYWYVRHARLNDLQQEILHLKLRHWKNQQIADHVNPKYNKTYTANYISTIFRQKIIPAINNTAAYHAKVIENLTFPENFKKCKTCGEMLLIDTDNFVRRARATDGFSNQCKRCDKAAREKKKEVK